MSKEQEARDILDQMKAIGRRMDDSLINMVLALWGMVIVLANIEDSALPPES